MYYFIEKPKSENSLPFKLAEYDNDTIVLLFFHDLIQLEIKGKNIIKDLKSSTSVSSHGDQFCERPELDKDQQRHLNYPLEKIVIKSCSSSNSRLSCSLKSMENNNGKKKIPNVYLRYCVALILGEIGNGNIMPLYKNIKYIKDLSMVKYELKFLDEFTTIAVHKFVFFRP
jgi:hypothetical protein